MNEKLKKIALKLSKKYKSTSVTEAYIQFMGEVGKNEEYFSLFKPEDLLKIAIYIYSYVDKKSFELGDFMIKNAWVGNFFEFGYEDYAMEPCEDCDDGYQNCEECDGNGMVDCDTCDGSGRVDCDECGGDGEDEEGDRCSKCEGQGDFDCDDCGGEGRINCSNCSGNGSITCEECGGDGEIESMKLRYYNQTFVVWDNKLIEMFMTSYELEKPTYRQDFVSFLNQSKMAFLSQVDESAEFKTTVQPDKKYCFYFEKLLSGSLSQINNRLISDRSVPSNFILE